MMLFYITACKCKTVITTCQVPKGLSCCAGCATSRDAVITLCEGQQGLEYLAHHPAHVGTVDTHHNRYHMKKMAIGCPQEETAQLKHSGDKWTPGVRHQIRHHTHHWHHSLLSKTVPSTEFLFAISLKGILPVSNYPWDCKYSLSPLTTTEPHCGSHIWVSFGAQLELSNS